MSGSLLAKVHVGLVQADEAYVLPVLLRFDGHPEVDQQVWCLFFTIYCFVPCSCGPYTKLGLPLCGHTFKCIEAFGVRL